MADNVLLIGRILQHYNLLDQKHFEVAARDYDASGGAGGGGSLGEFLGARGYLSAEQVAWLMQAVQHFEAQLRRSQQERPAPAAAAEPAAPAVTTAAAAPAVTAAAAAPTAAAAAAAPQSAPAASEATLESAISVASASSSWGVEGTQVANRGAEATLAMGGRGADTAIAIGSRGAEAALAMGSRGADTTIAIDPGTVGAGLSALGGTLTVVPPGQSGASLPASDNRGASEAPAIDNRGASEAPAIELSMGSSWSNLPMVEIEATSALSDRPATEDGPQMWGNLPLAVALATRPAAVGFSQDDTNQNPWGALAVLSPGRQTEEPEPLQREEPPLSFLPAVPVASQPTGGSGPHPARPTQGGGAPEAVPREPLSGRGVEAVTSSRVPEVTLVALPDPGPAARASEALPVLSQPAPDSLRTMDRVAEFNPSTEVTIHRSLDAVGSSPPVASGNPAGKAPEPALELRPAATAVGRAPMLPDRGERGEERPERTDRGERIEGRPSPSPLAPRANQPSPAGRVAIGVLRPAGGTQRRRQRDGKFAASAEAERDSRAPRRSLRSEETPAPPEVERLLGEALRLSASDLHLHVGAMPLLRIDGELRIVPGSRPVAPELTEQLLAHALSAPERRLLREGQDLAFALDLPGVGRQRVAVLQHHNGCDLLLRPIPARVSPLEDLGLPATVQQLALLRSGLLLCAGPMGSGKSTTLAALCEHMTQRRALRVLTIEDPIELRLQAGAGRGLVLQRQVGLHTPSCARALQIAQRDDFDVILVGAVPDAQSLRLVLDLAMDGRLVLAGVCAGGARQALELLLNLTQSSQRAAQRAALSQALSGVVAQRLVRRAEGRGRVLATEVLLCTPGIAALVQEERLDGLRGQALRERTAGMHFLDEALLTLVRTGSVTAAEARAQLQIPGYLHPDDVERGP